MQSVIFYFFYDSIYESGFSFEYVEGLDRPVFFSPPGLMKWIDIERVDGTALLLLKIIYIR